MGEGHIQFYARDVRHVVRSGQLTSPALGADGIVIGDRDQIYLSPLNALGKDLRQIPSPV
jgi:hypothetical protein